jgi:hypothetical protein
MKKTLLTILSLGTLTVSCNTGDRITTPDDSDKDANYRQAPPREQTHEDEPSEQE